MILISRFKQDYYITDHGICIALFVHYFYFLQTVKNKNGKENVHVLFSLPLYILSESR